VVLVDGSVDHLRAGGHGALVVSVGVNPGSVAVPSSRDSAAASET
jgi:hypothetical protein